MNGYSVRRSVKHAATQTLIDFLLISTRTAKYGITEIYPKFLIKRSEDLMIRGGDFYAVWVAEKNLWSTDEQDAIQLIDRELDIFAEKNQERFTSGFRVLHMWDAESGMIDIWHKYCQKQLRDNFHMLDEKLIFSNTVTCKKDYASKRLNYPLEQGEMPAYERLMSVLYSEKERRKIEWAIGSVVSGASKNLQKFVVLYGSAGTGKSTVLNIIQMLFDGYYSVFDAKSLGSSNNVFALEAFRSNPLVAIQHDGDLSKIEDNTRINSLVSHETIIVNEKFKAAYSNRFKCFLFIGTNKPVRITDAKSGLIRRLIDISPTGEKLSTEEYNTVMSRIPFELGAIAYRCKNVYLADPSAYDTYIPLTMMGASNDFFNFITDSYCVFKKEDSTTLKAAWEMYKLYCDDAKVSYPFSQRIFKEELKNYFHEYSERATLDDGARVRNYYSGFRTEMIDGYSAHSETENQFAQTWLTLDADISAFDQEYADCPAQYASENGTPLFKWDNVKTRLSDVDTSKLHYVKPPENLIVIDFDIRDGDKKSLEKNMAAASRFPPTYAELSKSEQGLHLHYIYTGDVSKLSRVYSDQIEIKVFTGLSSLRRRLTKHNSLPIAEISSGLPLKGEKMVDIKTVKSEKGLRTLIKKCLAKDVHPGTKPNIDFIFKILDDAYNNGLEYDVTDMKSDVLTFAANSTHHADYCIKAVGKMKFMSEKHPENIERENSPLIFFDVEVFPNLFLVNWKAEGDGKKVVRLINPCPTEIEELIGFRLVGFNCRRYDNHILYARLMGYTNEQLFKLSQKIISGDKHCFFGEAYNISYTDIYDFASAGNKKSLKKLEIEMGIHHQELGLPWDKPVPENMWNKVAEYCDNDVIAAEAAFNYLKGDWTARRILADVAGMTVNDTTNSLTARIIFGKERKPQETFNYRDLGKATDGLLPFTIAEDLTIYNRFGDPDYTVFDTKCRPVFPGYVFKEGKSFYRGEEVGEGGYVYSEPGIYTDVALLDIASMHPSSIVAENLFGDEYTARFKELMDVRIAIKHKDFNSAKKMLGGKLEKYLGDEGEADNLSKAFKTAINCVYGLTSAKFENPFRDIRNVDNIVAKRGALFMINLKHEVQSKGFTVAHIKTDSIKIPNATPEIIKFVTDYGKQYGYNFEHEATYERMCLVNDAVYIAKYKDGKHAGEWTATGAQFAVPYVFKKLFSGEEITFDDLCEIRSVSTALYLDMNEGLTEDEHNYRFVGKIGLFCPIKQGCGGGLLMREKDGKYYAAGSSKGYRWQEAEVVRDAGKECDIDISYYEKLAENAAEEIGKYGNFKLFVSEKPYAADCPDKSCDGYECCKCIHLVDDAFHTECDLGFDIPDTVALPF